MKLESFLLDHWLEQKRSFSGESFDLASSTGPALTLRKLLDFAGEPNFVTRLLDAPLTYTPGVGTGELRQAIADHEGVNPDHVQVCTGAAEGLLIVLHRVAEPGANVVLPSPDFPALSAVARSLGLQVRPYRLRREQDFRIDPEEIVSLVDRQTKLLVIISPHNPTGTVVDHATRRWLHDFCVERRIQFVCDQVYHPMYYCDAASVPSTAAALPEATVLGDCSKALCLSGLRVGWIVDRNPTRREHYLNARMYFTISNTLLGETLATLALQQRAIILNWAASIASTNLELLENFFRSHEDVFGWVRPAGGYTAFPWFRDNTDTTDFCQGLVDRGVLVAPGTCFGTPQHFRLGFGASGSRFAAGLERLDAYAGDYLRTRKRPNRSEPSSDERSDERS